MAITPNEITNKEFKKSLRGYDIDEVEEFLEQIVEDYEKLYKDNINLKEKIASLNEKLAHYTNIEETLQNTLIMAQNAADAARENAKKEGELIIKNAQEQAEEIKRKAQEDVLEITKKCEMLNQEFLAFNSRFRGMLHGQLESIERAEESIKMNIK